MSDQTKPIESVCTESSPDPDARFHPDAKGYGNDVYYNRYQCPHCGIRFKVEVPE